MIISNVLWLSVLLQVLAAFMALRLIPLTGRALAWSILSVAFILMASRRAISLLRANGTIESKWLTAMTTEVVALLISLFIVIGVFMIRSVFIKKRHDEDELFKLSQVVEQNSSSTFITDLDGKIEYVNQQFIERTGYALEEVKGKTPSFLDSGKTGRDVFMKLWKSIKADKVWVGEVCNKSKDGNLTWEKERVSPVKDADGKTTHYVAVLEDITEQKSQRDALEYMAMHDALTDLPNRALFYDRVNQSIVNAEHTKEPVAVLLADLNNFKVINDTLGHHIGDKILKEVALRLRNGIKRYDTVARMGGDEYLVLLPGVDKAAAVKIGQRLSLLVQKQFVIEGHHFDIGMSVGVAMFPEHGDDPDILIQRADVAMYSAKANIESVECYDSEQDGHSVSRLELLGEVRQAIENKQLCIHYQPRLNLHSMEVEGVEALVRWNHPVRGLIYPDEFIPILEETGNIKLLTRFVIESGLQQLADWQVKQPDFNMSINISTRDLCDPTLVGFLKEVMKTYEVPAETIIIEITESSLMQYTSYTEMTLNGLDEMGVGLAIDDFGTGYSSLQYLKELPVSELKIDKSFVMNMMDDDDDGIIVRSTIDLGHNLNLKVVAEGVEDEEASKLLQILKCDYAQGYYYSKPVESEEIDILLSGDDRRLAV